MERQSIGSLVKILSETMGQRVNRDCKGFNLTMQQMRILHFLKGREGKQGDPARRRSRITCGSLILLLSVFCGLWRVKASLRSRSATGTRE